MFQNMNNLLNAYEFWRYESKKNLDIDKIDEDGNIRDAMLM